MIRITLRDQALYTLWELDQNIAYARKDNAALRLDETLRSLLRNVRAAVQRLTVDEQ